MMSGLQNMDHSENLFSFELLVDNDTVSPVSEQLAVGVRLLDFPTLLIHEAEQSRGGKHGAHRFNRGKCCFFKMNLSSLHTHLTNTPLYVMVLDLHEEIPKLVGTSLLSLSKVMKRIGQDVSDHGLSAPSSHGERGLVSVRSLRGEKVGSISLSYKLQSLGGSLLPNAAQRRRVKSSFTLGGGGEEERHSNTESKPHVSSRKEGGADFSRNSETSHEDKRDQSVRDMQTGRQTPQTENENNSEEDSTLFCPPRLFFCNSAEERSKEDCTFVHPNSPGLTFEDSEDENKSDGASSPTVARRGKQDVKTSEQKETSGVSPRVLGEAVQQLPLLNALLVELSQLNGRSPQQPLAIHPQLAWIYRPASTEPSKSVHDTRQGISPNVKLLPSPRNRSTPLDRRASLRRKDKQSPGTSLRKKLVFGTTRTFNLRLKQISPSKVKTRECVGLLAQSKTQSGMSQEKRRTKSSAGKCDLKRSSSLSENIETVIQNVSEDSEQKQSVRLKEEGRRERKRDSLSPRNTGTASLPGKDSRLVHIPGVERDIFPPDEDESERHSESNQSRSDTHTGNAASSGSRSKSSFSGDEYADDFNSLASSDAFTPDLLSSPEPPRSKTPKSPVQVTSDSGSEGLCRRAALPVPVKAPSSPPQRALRGTHIIQPPSLASVLSSSSDSDRDTSASLQTILSRKQVTDSSGADSLTSRRGQRSEPTRSSRAAGGGFSAGSGSSCDPHEDQEGEDELGTLDLRKEYRHISELVANKLPGYTM